MTDAPDARPPASPLASLPGAVAADGPDAGVAAHYGEPAVEQRRLVAGEAVVDLSSRGVVAVTGPDRLSWLDSISSQRLTGMPAGASTETLFLDPAGRIEHAAHVVDDGTATWLLVETAAAPPLAAWLERMRFMLRVEPADVTHEWATLGRLTGPAEAAGELAAPAGGAEGEVRRAPHSDRDAIVPAAPNGVPVVWTDPWPRVAEGGVQYAREAGHPGAAWLYSETLVPRSSLPALADAVRDGRVALAGTLALEALRVEAWRPRWATEVDERSIPHELDWLRTAVHLAKGCYRGQETVAKVHNLGAPPRRLVLLQLDGSESVLPPAGSSVLRATEAGGEEAEVGVVTTSARHHELGPIALAVVKRSLAPDAPLVVPAEGTRVAAAQETIVPPDAGRAVDVPRLPRIGGTRRRA